MKCHTIRQQREKQKLNKQTNQDKLKKKTKQTVVTNEKELQSSAAMFFRLLRLLGIVVQSAHKLR